jgi:TPR repeat protein
MIAMLVCGLTLHNADAFAARPKNVKPKRAQQENEAPVVRPPMPTPEADALYRKGRGLMVTRDFRGAVPILKQAEALGSADAMVALGSIYNEGADGVASNTALAERYLKRAVAADSTQGYAALAVFYQRTNTSADRTKAENLLLQGIAKGHTKPYRNISGDTFSLYYFMANLAYGDLRLGLDRFAKARQWAAQGAEAGDPASMVLLSQLMQEDPKEALAWAQKASDLGSLGGKLRVEKLKADYPALFAEKPTTSELPADLSKLSAEQLYEMAQEAEKKEDWKKAAELFTTGAARGDKYSAYCAAQGGYYYLVGKGVPKDLDVAEKMFQQYADAGNYLGYTQLTSVYKAKYPGPIGVERARQVLQEGIGKGYTKLYNEMGKLEREVQNYEEALKWYWKGIDSGDGAAMAQLGDMYASGYGVEKNLGRALYWGRKSETAGEYFGTLLIKSLAEKGVTKEDVPSPSEGGGTNREAAEKKPVAPSPSAPTSAQEADTLFKKGMDLVQQGSIETAMPMLEQAMKLGSGEALVALGKIYAQRGDNLAAEQFFKRAVVMDFPHAYAALAVFYHQRNGYGDREKAGNLLFEGITRGHTKPFRNASGDTYSLFYFLANLAYLDAQAGRTGSLNAHKWANQGAWAGDPSSMVLLSQMYDSGTGTEKDPQTALMWAQKASDLGSGTGRQWVETLKKKYATAEAETPDASPLGNAAAAEPPPPNTPSVIIKDFNAQELYYQAMAAEKDNDFPRAARLYYEAAQKVDEDFAIPAGVQLAFYYQFGKGGIPKDFRKAEKYFRRSADAGNPFGFRNLAFLYGMEKQYPKARQVLTEGILKGHKTLYAVMGIIERDAMNYVAAKEWFDKGIALHDAESMFGLSDLYQKGHGVEKNERRALYWARKSAASGNPNGKQLVANLEKKGVTEEDVPGSVVVLKGPKETEEALNNVPSPAPVPPPVITDKPPVAQAPVSPEASPSPGSPLDPVFELLNRLPQPPPPGPPPGSPPDVAKTPDQSDAPPTSATNELAEPTEPAKRAQMFGEIQAAEAKALLETGYKAYQNGHYTRAFRLFREAAQKGNAQAQYEAAEMLIEGQGVEKDRATGKQWLMLSRMQGNADAKQLQARVEAEDAGKPKEAATLSPKPSEPVIATAEAPVVKPVKPPPPPVVEAKPVPIPITEKRVALVIGNSAYPGGAALSNPRNDADDLGSALRKVGFDVVSGTDLTHRGFADTMAQFAEKADGADVALVFYAGHAMQLEGENFLLPVDVRADSALNMRLTSLSLQTVIGEVETRVRTTLVLLDACRNNPIEEALKTKLRQSKRAIAETRGLARVTVNSPDTLVVFATQPNATAADGKGRNSPFTEALLESIAVPGVEIETLMKRVSAAVGEKTNQQQEPERLSRLKSEFYFVPVK